MFKCLSPSGLLFRSRVIQSNPTLTVVSIPCSFFLVLLPKKFTVSNSQYPVPCDLSRVYAVAQMNTKLKLQVKENLLTQRGVTDLVAGAKVTGPFKHCTFADSCQKSPITTASPVQVEICRLAKTLVGNVDISPY